MGYVRPNGEVGIRNDIWIVNTVGCVNKVAQRLGELTGAKYFPHPFGCSQLGDDQLVTQKALCGMVNHPNAGGVPGKIQFGSGWWFNDQRDGMESQMRALSNLGMISRFVGMLTDSRSFVSYTRHEYFRRIFSYPPTFIIEPKIIKPHTDMCEVRPSKKSFYRKQNRKMR